jgi:predicted HicB family RNase H-like nuclease
MPGPNKPGTFNRKAISMKKLTAGRPARLDYGPDDHCQMNVVVPPTLKRALVERADRSEHRLNDEVCEALASWVERERAV